MQRTLSFIRRLSVAYGNDAERHRGGAVHVAWQITVHILNNEGYLPILHIETYVFGYGDIGIAQTVAIGVDVVVGYGGDKRQKVLLAVLDKVGINRTIIDNVAVKFVPSDCGEIVVHRR